MKIKICGITNLQDAIFAREAGADYLGFIFYEKSPRYVSPDTAKEIIRKLPPETACIGVFVNVDNQTMIDIYHFCSLYGLQLHGEETIDQIESIEDIPIVKACAVQNRRSFEAALLFSQHTLLIDTPSKMYGGTGKVGNWHYAKKLASLTRIMLAGGLTPKNVAEAIDCVSPYGIDVSSGVEAKKRKKDPYKVKEFIQNARRYCSQRKYPPSTG